MMMIGTALASASPADGNSRRSSDDTALVLELVDVVLELLVKDHSVGDNHTVEYAL